MYEPVEKKIEEKSQLEAHGVTQMQNSNAPTSSSVDNRPEAIQMRKLRDLAKNSPQNAKLRELHHLAATHSVVQKKNNVKQGFGVVDNRPEATSQKKIKQLADNSTIRQLQVILQRGGSHGKKKKLNVQGKYNEGNGDVEFNDRSADISIVKGHGGYEDEDALADAWVREAYRLSDDAVVTIEKYNFFTAK